MYQPFQCLKAKNPKKLLLWFHKILHILINLAEFSLLNTLINTLTNLFYFGIQMQKASVQLGVPLSCVIPVRNYSEELELDTNCDILLLSAIIQMLRFADNYFDDVSNWFNNAGIKE